MKIYHLARLNSCQLPLPACALTIGNFDGVHLGHQAMLNTLTTLARQHDLASCVMIFEPQPREFFNPHQAPPRLTDFHEKITILQQFGIDCVIVASFDEAFRNLSAYDFSQMLINIGVKQLILGDDFRFGHDRTGDSHFLQNFGIPVTNIDTITDHQHQNERISSTRIRDCLLAGDLTTAKHLLGRNYSITGIVKHGDKIGRTLDFPTANIALNRLKPALHGVFAVEVTSTDNIDLTTLAKNGKIGISGFTKGSLFGTANIGTRPSVDKGQEWRLEIFFPEFDGDLYEQTLIVTFLHFLHGERHYSSLDALKIGILQDVQDLLDWRNNRLNNF